MCDKYFYLICIVYLLYWCYLDKEIVEGLRVVRNIYFEPAY